MNDIMLNILTVVGSILLLDLVLSGDNALVIGTAAAGFQKAQRWLIVALGGGVAIVLRLIFAILATQLLPFALLQVLSGLLLLLIAVRLLATRKETSAAASAASVQVSIAREGTHEALSARTEKGTALSITSLVAALLTILVADVILSLNNALTLSALAQGNGVLLGAGILLSVILLMPCSALVVKLIGPHPWLLDGAALLLAWTGAYIVLNGQSLGPLLGRYPWIQLVIPSAAFAIVLLADVLLRMRENRPTGPKQAG